MRKALCRTLAVLPLAVVAACSPLKEKPYIPQSAANGGPEDGAILAIEKRGGACFRADWVTSTLPEHSRFWFKDVVGNPVVCVCFSRPTDPAGLFQELAGLPGLQDLTLRETSLTDQSVRGLSKLTGLRSLWLGDSRMTVGGYREIAQLKNLENLELSYERGEYSPVELKSDDLDDECLNELKALSQLRALKLRKGRITDAGIRHLAAFARLERLELSCTELKLTEAGVANLATLRNLTELRVHEATLTGKGLKDLARLTNLEVLDLRSSNVSSADIANLVPLTRLKELNLSCSPNMSDHGLDELAKFPCLTVLDISSTKVTDSGIRSIAQCPRLESLNVSGTPITDKGLLELTTCRSLRSVNAYTTDLTNSGVRRFRSKHGNCLVTTHSD